jgi:hypothetical protein
MARVRWGLLSGGDHHEDAHDVLAQFDVGLDLPRRDELELIGSSGKLTIPDPRLCRRGYIELERDGHGRRLPADPSGTFGLAHPDHDVYRIELETISAAIAGREQPSFGRADVVDQATVLQPARRPHQSQLAIGWDGLTLRRAWPAPAEPAPRGQAPTGAVAHDQVGCDHQLPVGGPVVVEAGQAAGVLRHGRVTRHLAAVRSAMRGDLDRDLALAPGSVGQLDQPGQDRVAAAPGRLHPVRLLGCHDAGATLYGGPDHPTALGAGGRRTRGLARMRLTLPPEAPLTA